MNYIEKAFAKIPRRRFVPEDLRDRADIDAPLPIGFGQTISQPTTVRMMLRWLEPEPGNKVLDIGSGSGWTSGLLSVIVGNKGKVYAVETIPELVELGRSNCQKFGLKNVSFHKAGKEYGLPKSAPYDRILVSAAAQEFPAQLLKQLKAEGKIVIPVKDNILEITKTSKAEHETVTHPGFVFVPLV